MAIHPLSFPNAFYFFKFKDIDIFCFLALKIWAAKNTKWHIIEVIFLGLYPEPLGYYTDKGMSLIYSSFIFKEMNEH